MDQKTGIGYFLLGLGIGVAAGILWAPKSGQETRKLIADKAGESADYIKTRAGEGSEFVRQRTGEIKKGATDMYEQGRSTVLRHKENLNAAVEAGKQAYREAMSDLKAASASAGSSSGEDAV